MMKWNQLEACRIDNTKIIEGSYHNEVITNRIQQKQKRDDNYEQSDRDFDIERKRHQMEMDKYKLRHEQTMREHELMLNHERQMALSGIAIRSRSSSYSDLDIISPPYGYMSKKTKRGAENQLPETDT